MLSALERIQQVRRSPRRRAFVATAFLTATASLSAAATTAAATTTFLASVGSLLVSIASSTAIALAIQASIAALEGDTEVEGQKLLEIPLQTVSEGAIIPRVYGDQAVKIGGNMIWVSDFMERMQRDTVDGGWFAGDTTYYNYKYYVHVAFGLCEGEMEAIDKVWANGQLIWDNIFVGGTKTFGPSIKFSIEQAGSSFWAIPAARLVSDTVGGGPDLSKFKEFSAGVTITGFTTSANNVTLRMIWGSGTFEDGSGKTYVVLQQYPGLFRGLGNPMENEVAGDSVTVTAVVKMNAIKLVTSITSKKGSTTQDPILSAFMLPPVTQVDTPANPGYRGTAYAFMYFLALEEFGNRIPQFTFSVIDKAGRTVAETIEEVLKRGDFVAAEYDTSNVASRIMRGYRVDGNRTTSQILAPLLRIFNLTVTEDGSTLRFNDRPDAITRTISSDDMACRQLGNAPPRAILITSTNPDHLPETFDLQYLDYITGNAAVEKERRFHAASLQTGSTAGYSAPIVLRPLEAREIAQRELYKIWQNSQRVAFTLPPNYVDLQENDRLSVPSDSGKAFVIVINEIRIGSNFVVEVEGLVESIETIDLPTAEGEEDNKVDNRFRHVPIQPYWAILDIAALTTEVTGVVGFYLAVMKDDPSDIYDGANFIEWDDTESVATFIRRIDKTTADGGELDSQLNRPYQDDEASTQLHIGNTWDYVNEIDVRIYQGTPESRTKAEVYAGKNTILVGDEIIGFTTAVDQSSPDKEGRALWKLTGLLRGMRGTEYQMLQQQSVTAIVIWLQPDKLAFIPLNTDLIGKDTKFKLVPAEADSSDYGYQDPIFYGGPAMSFIVCHAEIWDDASGNLHVTWRERSADISHPLRAAHNRFSARYTIRIWEVDADGETSVQVDNVTEYVVSRASIGFAATSDVKVKIYQESPFGGDPIGYLTAFLVQV